MRDFRIDGPALCIHRGGHYVTVCVCQSQQNCTMNRVSLCVNYTLTFNSWETKAYGKTGEKHAGFLQKTLGPCDVPPFFVSFVVWGRGKQSKVHF